MANPQQGWYPDPQDASRVRWWDGNEWTQYTQPHPHLHAAADDDGEELDDLAASDELAWNARTTNDAHSDDSDSGDSLPNDSESRDARSADEQGEQVASTTEREHRIAPQREHAAPDTSDEVLSSTMGERPVGNLTMASSGNRSSNRTSAVPQTWQGTYHEDPTNSVRAVHYAEPGHQTHEQSEDSAASNGSARHSDPAATDDPSTRVVKDLLTTASVPLGSNDVEDADPSDPITAELEEAGSAVGDPAPDPSTHTDTDAGRGMGAAVKNADHKDPAPADPEVLKADHSMGFVAAAFDRADDQPAEEPASARGSTDADDADFAQTGNPADADASGNGSDDPAPANHDAAAASKDATAATGDSAAATRADERSASDHADEAETAASQATAHRPGAPDSAGTEPTDPRSVNTDEVKADEANSDMVDPHSADPDGSHGEHRGEDTPSALSKDSAEDVSRSAGESAAGGSDPEDPTAQYAAATTDPADETDRNSVDGDEPSMGPRDGADSAAARSAERAAMLESRVALSDRATKAEVAAQTARYELHLLTEQNASEERTLTEAIELAQREVDYSQRHEEALKEEVELARLARLEAEQREEQARIEHEAAAAATLEAEQEAARVAEKARQLLRAADERREAMQRRLLAANDELERVRAELEEFNESKPTPRVGRHRTRRGTPSRSADTEARNAALSDAAGHTRGANVGHNLAPETDQFWRASGQPDADALSAASAAVLAAGRPHDAADEWSAPDATDDSAAADRLQENEAAEPAASTVQDKDDARSERTPSPSAEETSPTAVSDSDCSARQATAATATDRDDSPRGAAPFSGSADAGVTASAESTGADSPEGDDTPTTAGRKNNTSKAAGDRDVVKGLLLEQGTVNIDPTILENEATGSAPRSDSAAVKGNSGSQDSAADGAAQRDADRDDEGTGESDSSDHRSDEPQVQRSPRWDEDNPAGPVPLRSGLRLGPMVDPDDYNVDSDVPMTGAQVKVKVAEARQASGKTSPTDKGNDDADDSDSEADEAQPKSAHSVTVTGAELPDLDGGQNIVEIDPMTGSIVAVTAENEDEAQPKVAHVFEPEVIAEDTTAGPSFDPDLIIEQHVRQPKTAAVVEPTLPTADESDPRGEHDQTRGQRHTAENNPLASGPAADMRRGPRSAQHSMPATSELTSTVTAADRSAEQRQEVAAHNDDAHDNAAQPEFAEPWSRLAAAAIDTLVLLLVVGAFTFSPLTTLVAQLQGNDSPESLGAAGYGVLGGAIVVIPFLYGLFCYRFGGQTLGNKLLGIRVAAGNGAPTMSWAAAALRSLVKYPLTLLGSALFGLGLVNYAWCLRPARQCLHDIIADTAVIVPDSDS